MFKTRICARCGKMFIPGAEHLYKIEKDKKVNNYCSYTCWRKDGGDNGGTYRRI